MIITADANGRTDGTAHRFVQMIKSELPIVLVSRCNDFVFNTSLNRIKDYILICFTEYNWDWDRKNTHKWGVNTKDFSSLFPSDEWNKFDDFVAKNPPKLTLKRELLKKDKSSTLLPIEYPNWVEKQPIQTKEQFNSRLIEVFFYWGHSHECRRQLHGNIWLNSSVSGYSVCDNLYYFENFMKEEKGSKWVTFNMPHYGRTDIKNLMMINANSKLSVSLPGAGVKCFRSTGESPINSVMVCQEDTLAWTFDWVDGFNCIKVPNDGSIESIRGIGVSTEIPVLENSLKRDDLYDIYLNGVETADKYYCPNYISYLEKIINKA